MEDFTITTRLSTQEYRRVMIVGLYRKPAFILATLVGVILLTTVVLDYLGVIDYYSDIPVFETLCGAFLLLMPILIVWISVRQFTSNPSFQSDMIYTFSENGANFYGSTLLNKRN